MTIANGVEKTRARNARIAQQGDSKEPIRFAPAQVPIAPVGPILDLPVGGGSPQRGTFPAATVLASDLSDSTRAFRQAGMRSAVFPYPTLPQNTGSSLVATIQAKVTEAQTESVVAGQKASAASNAASSASSAASTANANASTALATAGTAQTTANTAQTTATNALPTPSNLSYRPTSQPITSTDAGANATVSIASFNLRVRSPLQSSDVSYNSGSVTSLSYGTLYYIYLNDPTFAGGSPTYNATTTKESVLSNDGNVFIGSILTAVSGGGTQSGNNDGGTGGQAGNTVIVRPSTVTGTFTNETNAIDGNSSTDATCSGASQVLTVSGFSGMVLPAIQNVNAIVDWGGNSSGASPSWEIQVSSNSGGSFTTVLSGTGFFARTQSVIALGQNINPALYQIRVATTSGASSGGLQVYEIYLSEQF